MDKISRLPGQVSEYFIIETVVVALRTGDIYKALDKYKRQSVALYRTRGPLGVTTGLFEKFVDRLSRMNQFGIARDTVLSYGIDASGYGFVVFPAVDGVAITAGKVEIAEQERRFLAVLRFLDKLHTNGIPCEDFTSDSFIVERSGVVRYLGIVGAFEITAAGTAELPSIQALRYAAPELDSTSEGSLRADVFAIGMLGYRLFSGEYPEINDSGTYEEAPLVSSRNPKVAGWVDVIVARCLGAAPEVRFASAGEVLTAINEWREADAQKDTLPAVTGKQVSQAGAYSSGAATPILLGRAMGEDAPPQLDYQQVGPQSTKKLGRIGWGALVGLLLVLGWIGYQFVTSSGPRLARAPISVVPGDIDTSSLSDTSKEGSKARFIQSLVASDDPLSHDALLKEVKEAGSPEMVDYVWRAILDRGRRLGLVRSSDQLRAWAKSMGPEFSPLTILPLLRCLEPGIPADERDQVLKEAYTTYPRLVMRFLAALALDSKKPENFQTVVSGLVSQQAKLSDAKDHSVLAVFLLVPEVSQTFLEDIMGMAAQVPDSDVVWVLRRAAEENSAHTAKLADLALSRKIAPSPRGIFLEVLRRAAQAPHAVTLALVRGSLGEIALEDVGAIGHWLSKDSFISLATVVATVADEKVKEAAYNSMVSKPQADAPMTRLIEFVKANYKEKPTIAANALSAVALQEFLTDEEIVSRLADIEGFPRHKDFLAILISTESSKLVRLVLGKYGSVIPASSVLPLLSFADKNIRLSAVKLLSKANDVVALKLILEAYEIETDVDVKKAYEENIAAVRERRSRRK